jgi:SET domain-containing protein
LQRTGLFVVVTQATGLAFSTRFGDSVLVETGLLAETGPGTMMLIRTYVAASAIEGVGMFAAEPIKKGASIWRLDPDFDRLIPMDKYEAAPAPLKELLDRYAYPSPDRSGFMVYEVDNGRFMNHSATPNTDFSQYGGATATQDIAAGEEITCDYGEFFEDFERLHLATA